MTEENFHIADLLVWHLIGDLSDEKQRILDHWLDMDDENCQLMDDIGDTEWLQQRLQEYMAIDGHDSWDELRRCIPELAQVEYDEWPAGVSSQPEERLARERSPRVISLFRNKAAMWIVLIGVALLVSFIVSLIYRSSGKEDQRVVSAPPPVVNGTYLAFTGSPAISLADRQQGWTIREGNMKISMPSEGVIAVSMPGPSATGADAREMLTLHTAAGKSYRLLMPDSSVISLNAASSVRFSGSFNQERLVTLEGEAYFEVKKTIGAPLRKNKPFIVRVRSKGPSEYPDINWLTVTTVGTVFDVKAYDSDSRIQTSLVSGHVLVQKTGDRVARHLNPGYAYVLGNDGSGSIQKMDTLSDAVSWREEQFDFVGQPIADILQDLSRWYNIPFEYQEKPIGLYRLKGSRKESLSELLNQLEYTNHLHFTIQPDKVIVSIVSKNH
jgi:ferric-dicitrate binding protein FerR (iron transport regulator)